MRINFRALLIFFACLHSAPAWSLPDASLGARASIGAAQELLVAPPLPSLESGGKMTFSPQVGQTNITTEGSKYFPATTVPSTPAYTQTHKGELSGPSLAFALSSPPKGRFGWFGFVVASQLSGELNAYQAGTPTFSLDDMNATAAAAVAGASFRIYGESKSRFAIGAFLGPAYMNVQSAFTLVQHDIVTANQELSIDANISAAYSGLQFKFRFGKFLLNPYALYMKELSDKCKDVDNSGSARGCIDIDASFSGYGLFLGYGGFRIRAAAAVLPSSTMEDLTYSSYTVSYTFGL